MLKKNKTKLKALKNRPSRLEREIFGVDRNGNPLKPKQNTEVKEENIRLIAKGIEQRFFETKVKYENLSYIKYDGRKKVKPLIN